MLNALRSVKITLYKNMPLNKLSYNIVRFDFTCRFYDHTPQGEDRLGHTWGGVLNPQVDGFVRGTTMDTKTLGEHMNSTATLRRLEPYVARYMSLLKLKYP